MKKAIAVAALLLVLLMALGPVTVYAMASTNVLLLNTQEESEDETTQENTEQDLIELISMEVPLAGVVPTPSKININAIISAVVGGFLLVGAGGYALFKIRR